MKISILGAGNVSGTLGGAWARKGHDVFFGDTLWIHLAHARGLGRDFAFGLLKYGKEAP